MLQQRTQAANRLHKLLEGANSTLAVVAADILGTSGRAMLEALLAGEEDPATLADLARGRLRAKRPALHRALTGRVQAPTACCCGRSWRTSTPWTRRWRG